MSSVTSVVVRTRSDVTISHSLTTVSISDVRRLKKSSIPFNQGALLVLCPCIYM